MLRERGRQEIVPIEQLASTAGLAVTNLLRHRTERVGSVALKDTIEFSHSHRTGPVRWSRYHYAYQEQFHPDRERLEAEKESFRSKWDERDPRVVATIERLDCEIESPQSRDAQLDITLEKDGEHTILRWSQVEDQPMEVTISIGKEMVTLRQISGSEWRVSTASNGIAPYDEIVGLHDQRTRSILETVAQIAKAAEKPLDAEITKRELRRLRGKEQNAQNKFEAAQALVLGKGIGDPSHPEYPGEVEMAKRIIEGLREGQRIGKYLAMRDKTWEGKRTQRREDEDELERERILEAMKRADSLITISTSAIIGQPLFDTLVDILESAPVTASITINLAVQYKNSPAIAKVMQAIDILAEQRRGAGGTVEIIPTFSKSVPSSLGNLSIK